MEKGMEIRGWGQEFYTLERRRAVKRVQFASFRVSFSAERSVVNAHVPSDDATDESADSFFE